MGHLSRRYWALGSTATEMAETQDKAARDMMDEMGLPTAQVKQAGFLNRHMGNDRMPSMDSGLPTQRKIKDDMVAPGRVGGDGILIEGTHTNSNGDRIVTAYRKNGPLLEKIHIREERVGERTRIISEIYGGHS
jgi:hypothetical protein